MTSRLSGVERYTLPEKECVVQCDSEMGPCFDGLVHTLWCYFGVFTGWDWTGKSGLLQVGFRLHLFLVLACALCPGPPPGTNGPPHATVFRDRTAQ